MGTERAKMTHRDIRQSESYDLLGKNGKNGLSVEIRNCGMDELKNIAALQRAVYETVPLKETFVLTTKEELGESLLTDICFGAYHNGRLIAFTLVVTNPDSPRNLGYYLNYDEERRLKCVTYDTTFVHPDYTGYGLQKLFISLKDAASRALGAGEALATVSPSNTVSLKNLEANGFEIADIKQMYGELHRYIMRKPLVQPE